MYRWDTYLRQKKIVPVAKLFFSHSSQHRKVCATNKPIRWVFRGYIDDQNSSKCHTFFRGFRELFGKQCLKTCKIRIFERLKNEKICQDPDFMVNLFVKPSNIEESDPI